MKVWVSRCGAAMASAFLGLGVFVPVQGQSNYFSETNKTITRIGVQGASSYYVGMAEPLGQTCLYGILYIDGSRKVIYAQLLASKVAGKKVSRIDYTQPGGAGTTCWVELVELGD